MKKLYISLSALLATGFAAQAQDGMGIGNSNPQEMLDVTGAIKIGGTIVGAADAGSIRWNGTNFQGYDGSQWVNLDESGGTDADWTVSGNNQSSAVSGNVGIGTASPLGKLHLEGTGELLRVNGSGTNVTLSRWYVGGSPRMELSSLSASGAHLTLYNASGTYSTRIAADAPSFFRFSNVGIGTDSPSANLDVEGSFQYIDGNQTAGMVLASDANGNASWADPNALVTAGDSDWTVSGNNQSSAVSGNVGIGTSSPLGKLHLDGGGELFRVRSTSTNVTMSRWYANSSPRMDFTTLTATGGQLTLYNQSGTYSTRIGSGGDSFFRFGNIGIGTDSPTSKLEVAGQVKITGGTPGAGKVLTSDANGLATWETPGAGASIADADNDTKIQVEETGDEDKIRFDTGNIERMIIDNSGNVGIGDNSPSNRLHVSVNEGTGLSVPILVQNTGSVNAGGTGSGIGFSNMGNIDNAKAILYNERTADYGIGKLHVLMNNSNNTAAATLADARMTILSDGNVGIGTTSPTSELEVSGQLKVSGSSPAARLLLTGYSTTEGGELQLDGGSSYTNSAYAIDNFEGRLRVMKTTNAGGTGSTSTEMFSVKPTGQVGIGNIAGNAWPSESVFIVGPQDNGSEGGQIQFYNSNGAGTAWFLDVYGNDFRFLTGNNISGSSASAMALTNAGNLTTSGNIRASTGKYYFETGCDNYLALQSDGNAVIYNSGGGFMGWASGTSCSDIRLKENVRPLENVLRNLVDLSAIRYTYKPETGLTQAPQIGVVAQELAEKYPEMVLYNKELDQYLVYYDKLTVLLLKGMQEQQRLIDELKNENIRIQKEMQGHVSLMKDLDKLKVFVGFDETSNVNLGVD